MKVLISVYFSIYHDEIKKLLGDINEKNEQNKQFEKEKNDLEYQVEEQ